MTEGPRFLGLTDETRVICDQIDENKAAWLDIVRPYADGPTSKLVPRVRDHFTKAARFEDLSDLARVFVERAFGNICWWTIARVLLDEVDKPPPAPSLQIGRIPN